MSNPTTGTNSDTPARKRTHGENRITTSMTLLVLGLALALIGVIVAMLGIAPAIVLVPVGIGLAMLSRRPAKRLDAR